MLVKKALLYNQEKKRYYHNVRQQNAIMKKINELTTAEFYLEALNQDMSYEELLDKNFVLESEIKTFIPILYQAQKLQENRSQSN